MSRAKLIQGSNDLCYPDFECKILPPFLPLDFKQCSVHHSVIWIWFSFSLPKYCRKVGPPIIYSAKLLNLLNQSLLIKEDNQDTFC